MSAQNRQQGFSMIEMLVAATIMVVLVMMLGMVFQGTSAAWRIGVKRADSYMHLRSLLGAIQRDAAAAVDQHTIDKELYKIMGEEQAFSKSELAFYTLSGTYDLSRPNEYVRALKFVRYKQGKRTETTIVAPAKTKAPVTSNVKEFVKRNSSPIKNNTDITQINVPNTFDNSVRGVMPPFIIIDAEIAKGGESLEIGAASAGPDKAWNTKDDIRTWVK